MELSLTLEGQAKAKQIDQIKKQMQELMHAVGAGYDMQQVLGYLRALVKGRPAGRAIEARAATRIRQGALSIVINRPKGRPGVMLPGLKDDLVSLVNHRGPGAAVKAGCWLCASLRYWPGAVPVARLKARANANSDS